MTKNSDSFLRKITAWFENWPPTAVLMFLVKVTIGLAALIGAVAVITNWLDAKAVVAVYPGWLPCGQPVVLPNSIDPWQDINGAYDSVIRARKNGDYETWQVGPAILGDRNQNFLLTLDVTSRVQGNETIKIDNTLAVTVELVKDAPERANLVVATRPCGGGYANHAFPELGISQDAVLTLVSPNEGYFNLQPGQLDVFGLPIRCAAPGVYRVQFSMIYTHLNEPGEIAFESPELVCPVSTSQWDVVQEMEFRGDFAWNGKAYEPIQVSGQVPNMRPEPVPTVGLVSPEQALVEYYAALNERQYERAWGYLSPAYQAKVTTSFDQYVDDWNSVEQVNVASISIIEHRADFATALVELQIQFRQGRSDRFRQYIKLVYDAGSQRWLLAATGPNS